jgi:imidazolonepropionase-like amidohydrolase
VETRDSGTRVVPGLVSYRGSDPVFVERLVVALHRSEVPLLVGTGAMAGGAAPGTSVSDELGLLVALGFSPYEALRAATVEPARFAGLAGKLGTVVPGARADLLLLARNPLEDVTAVRRPLGVVLRGRWLDPEHLDDLIREN